MNNNEHLNWLPKVASFMRLRFKNEIEKIEKNVRK
jgi:hypothetical protein